MLREDWLERMIELLRPDFVRADAKLPEHIRVSCGFPSEFALSQKKRCVGECWDVKCSEDKSSQVFISPVLKESIEVSAALVHELVHAAVGIEHKHRGPFPKVAKAMGLEGKITGTEPGEVLRNRLKELVNQIGEYPHARLVASNKPKTQTTRMLKVTCINKDCGCIVRMTAKWITDVGCPTCACGSPMKAEEGVKSEEGEENPQESVYQG